MARRWLNDPRAGRRTAVAAPLAGALVAAIGTALWLRHTPPVGDLAAQTAWAHLAGRVGFVPWWAGWYGGVSVGGYSLVTPVLMAAIGVRTVGAIATVATGVVAGVLLRSPTNPARRPVLGAAVFGLAAVADLYSGRVTFAAGGLVALVALLLAERGRPVAAAVLAVAATATSPVAGVLLLVPAAVLVLRDPERRRAGVALVAGVGAATAVIAWLFPAGGREPFASFVLRPALFTVLLPVLLPVGRRVRAGFVLAAAATAAAYFVTSPLGSNVTRLAILVAVPTVVASVRAVWLLPVAAWLAVWPWHQLNDDLSVARHPSARSSAGLLTAVAGLPHDRRVEVVEPRTHWAVTRVVDAGHVIARGWERQADEQQNPLFYGRSPLTPTTYRTWLDDHAVGWVALPTDSGDLDFGSAAEGELVRRGLPYLQVVRSEPGWVLYRVTDPAPVATDPSVAVELTDTGAVLTTTGPTTATLRLRWSRWYVLDGGTVERDGDLVRVHTTTAGAHRLHAVWRPPW